MLLPNCNVLVCSSCVPAFLLLVLVVDHLSERLRLKIVALDPSFRMVFLLFVPGFFVRFIPSRTVLL